MTNRATRGGMKGDFIRPWRIIHYGGGLPIPRSCLPTCPSTVGGAFMRPYPARGGIAIPKVFLRPRPTLHNRQILANSCRGVVYGPLIKKSRSTFIWLRPRIAIVGANFNPPDPANGGINASPPYTHRQIPGGSAAADRTALDASANTRKSMLGGVRRGGQRLRVSLLTSDEASRRTTLKGLHNS